MARVPLEPGRWGRIGRKQVSPTRWRARAQYRAVTGVLRTYEASGTSAAAAQRALEDKLERLRSDGPLTGTGAITPTTRMKAVFDQWIEEKRAGGQVAPQSLAKYVETLNLNLRRAYGALRVREVTPVAVNRVLMALSKEGKFDTARQARNVMSQVMMVCVRYGAAPFNPVRDAVTIRKPQRRDVRTIRVRGHRAPAQGRPGMGGPAGHPGGPQRHAAAADRRHDAGHALRIGDCLALRVQDLDLDAEVPTLSVTGTLVRADGRLFREPRPKSASSERAITVPAFVVAALHEAIGLGLDGGPDGLVFPSTRDTPRSPARVREQLRQAQSGTGLRVTPHDFQRTVATQVANNTSLTNATILLGHSDETTTKRHYVRRLHVAPDLHVVIDQLISRADGLGAEPQNRG